MSLSLNKKKRVGGYIALLNLQDWWNDSFSKEEQKHIVEVYQPFGHSKTYNPLGWSENPLVSGDLYHNNDDRPLMFLSNLAGWFNNKNDRGIAHKIIAKAEEYIPFTKNVLDIHFFWADKMKIFYTHKERDNPITLQEVINACLKQIEIADKAALSFQKDLSCDPLPFHEGYEQLCSIYEKQGKFEDAIKLAEQAKKQGWRNNWNIYIERCKKKLLKQTSA